MSKRLPKRIRVAKPQTPPKPRSSRHVHFSSYDGVDTVCGKGHFETVRRSFNWTDVNCVNCKGTWEYRTHQITLKHWDRPLKFGDKMHLLQEAIKEIPNTEFSSEEVFFRLHYPTTGRKVRSALHYLCHQEIIKRVKPGVFQKL